MKPGDEAMTEEEPDQGAKTQSVKPAKAAADDTAYDPAGKFTWDEGDVVIERAADRKTK
jgi:hypothetical protein